ncbi:lipoyl protein ligase domain-containing protein [Chlamydiifrater volucris]|uniref:lipoyl protein ligase domain-containing protein n=1 Tax=Chlamydiifrater volucris TaxID=2681470 RepID=UPI001BCAA9C7|nr:lipoate--protein ligase family protein [Chlamydiifrater volucris]
MKRKIFDSGSSSSKENMSIDARLLHSLEGTKILLHLYSWKHLLPVTCGYFVNPEDVFISKAFSLIDLAKRPTGGGVVFHDADFAFSLLVSASHPLFSENVLDNYRVVNTLVVKSIQRAFGLSGDLSMQGSGESRKNMNFCMAKISRYDVIFQGQKIGGAAQRTTSRGFLHQGTVFLSGRCREFYQALLKEDVLDFIWGRVQESSFYFLGNDKQGSLLEEARRSLRDAFIYEFCHWDDF